MSLDSLPTGYCCRKAKLKDLPQLFLQKHESNSFDDDIGLKKHVISIYLTAALIYYLLGFDYLQNVYDYGNTDVIDAIEKILYLLKYRISDDTQSSDFILNEMSSYFGIICSLISVLITSILLAIYCSLSLCSKAWVIEVNEKIIASVIFNLNTSRLENIYVNPQFRYQGFGSYQIKYLQSH